MMSYSHSSQSPQSVNLVRPGKTYRHSLGIRRWILTKEKSLELQDLEPVKYQRLLMEEHLERCLLLVDKNQVESKN